MNIVVLNNREGEWNLIQSAGGGCLTRDFTGTLPDAVAVAEVLDYPANDFCQFESDLRVNLHNTVHVRIGEIMSGHDAASAPEFFLHHGYIDKIWGEWQSKGIEYQSAYFPEDNEKLLGTNTYYTTDFIDMSAQPGGVKVEYRDSDIRHNEVYKYLKSKICLFITQITRIISLLLLADIFTNRSQTKEGSGLFL